MEFRSSINPTEYVSGERLADLCDEAYWIPAGRRTKNPANLAARDGTVIYSHTDQVFGLFNLLRTKPGRYIVVTAESDHAVTPAYFHARPWNVVEWFGVNATASHPFCHVLPLGVANEACGVTMKPVAAASHSVEKRSWLYVNHRIETNPAARRPLYEHFAQFRQESWVTVREPLPSGEMGSYPEDLASHRFVCCPPGNGIDTHRMWEALYVGTIPIVLKNPVTDAFRDLPIVQVRDYSEVSLSFLEKAYEELLRRQFSWEKATMSYWARQLDEARRRVRAASRAGLIWRWLQRKTGSIN